jgi:hypothetical protein
VWSTTMPPIVSNKRRNLAMLCAQPSTCQAVARHYSSTPPRLLRHQCRALPAAAAASLAIAFLPWSGCSQGGFYATGEPGSIVCIGSCWLGDACSTPPRRQLWLPLWATSPCSSTPTAFVYVSDTCTHLLMGCSCAGVAGMHGKDCQAMYQPAAAAEERFAARLRQQLVASQPQDNTSITAPGAGPGPSSSPSSSAPSPSSSSSSGPSRQQDEQLPEPQQLTAAEHMEQVPDAAKDLVRDILHEDNRQRTKQLVDDAWQTLE